MNQSQAFAKAKKMFGPTAAIRDSGPKMASTPEVRAAAHDAYRALAKREQDKDHALFSASMRYRFAVGCIMFGLFFEVRGHGDTWEEAFAEADRTSKPVLDKGLLAVDELRYSSDRSGQSQFNVSHCAAQVGSRRSARQCSVKHPKHQYGGYQWCGLHYKRLMAMIAPKQGVS